jgi:hypothetical protein
MKQARQWSQAFVTAFTSKQKSSFTAFISTYPCCHIGPIGRHLCGILINKVETHKFKSPGEIEFDQYIH